MTRPGNARWSSDDPRYSAPPEAVRIPVQLKRETSHAWLVVAGADAAERLVVKAHATLHKTGHNHEIEMPEWLAIREGLL